MNAAQLIPAAAVAGFTLTAAVCDYRTKKLPNWLTVPAFAAGLVFHVVSGAMHHGFSGSLSGLLFALGGFATGFGILLVLWLIGGGGAGDVKMMGALGGWLGATMTLYVFFVSVVFVMVGSAGAIAYQMISRGMVRTKNRYLRTPDAKDLPADPERRGKHSVRWKRGAG